MRPPRDLGFWGGPLAPTLSPRFGHQATVCSLGRVPGMERARGAGRGTRSSQPGSGEADTYAVAARERGLQQSGKSAEESQGKGGWLPGEKNSTSGGPGSQLSRGWS